MNFALPALLSILSAAGAAAADAPFQAVEFWKGNEAQTLQPLTSAAPRGTRQYDIADLPLVLNERSLLRLGSSTYLLDQEGLYRIRRGSPAKVVRQTILYRGDVWRLVGHLNRLYVYGARHHGESQARWDERARGGELLSLQCGYVSMFIHHQLSLRNIPSRLVGCVNGSDWKIIDNGHALMEVCDLGERRWVLYDPTLGARFRHRGRLLNLLDMTNLYRAGGRADQIEFLNAWMKLDPLTDYQTLYARYIADADERTAFVTRFEPLLQNDTAAIHRWYGRMMQIPLIGEYFVPGSDAEDSLLRTLPTWKNLVRLSTAQFQERFYAQPCCPAARVATSDQKQAVPLPKR